MHTPYFADVLNGLRPCLVHKGALTTKGGPGTSVSMPQALPRGPYTLSCARSPVRMQVPGLPGLRAVPP